MDRQHAIERAEESAKFIRKFCRNEMRYGNCADCPFHMNARAEAPAFRHGEEARDPLMLEQLNM